MIPIQSEAYNLLFCDFETGGFEHDKHPSLQVAAIITEGPPDYKELSVFSTYIRPTPKLTYTQGARDVHNIDEQWLYDNAPYARHVANSFLSFLMMTRRPLRFAGHNCPFDIKFATALLSIAGARPIWHPSLTCDTLVKSRADLNIPSHKLGDVCNHLGVKLTNAHSAYGDIKATIKCARKLEKLKNESTTR